MVEDVVKPIKDTAATWRRSDRAASPATTRLNSAFVSLNPLDIFKETSGQFPGIRWIFLTGSRDVSLHVTTKKEPNKDIQKLLKPSSSGDLSKELFHHPAGEEEEEGGLSGHTASLLHITEKRQPLSSVSSLEVHFDLLDLTELTDMSDQELAEVFADSDEENHNESPAGSHQPMLPRGGYMRSPSWTRCSRVEPPRERKHHSDSDTPEPLMKLERPKQP